MPEPDTSKTSAPRKRRSAARRVGRASVIVVLLLAGLIVGGTLWLFDRPLQVPAWAQDRIETRLAQDIPLARVTFGEIRVVVERGWKPRVRLRNVRVETLAGVEIIAFREFKARLSTSALLQRKIAPGEVSLDGVVLKLERSADGRVSLQGGTGRAGPMREFENLGALVDDLDSLMSRPVLASLEQAELRALTVQFTDLRANRAWTVDGGRLILNRDGDTLSMAADLAVLGGESGIATLAANYTSDIGASEAGFGLTFDGFSARDIATQSPAFGWLDVLRAPISGSVRTGVLPDGSLAPLNATLQIGAGVVQPNRQTTPIPFDGARSYLSYDASEGVLRFDELSLRSKWVSGQAEGTATLGRLENGQFSDLVGQFSVNNLSANPQQIYPSAVSLDSAEMDFRLRLNPFRFDLGRLQLNDQGQILQATGQLAAGQGGWDVAVDAQMDAVSLPRLMALWPVTLKPKTRAWLAKNLKSASVSNADLALRYGPETPLQTFLAFDYEDAEVTFLRHLPPITQARGHGSMERDRFVISLDGGQVEAAVGGAVALTGSSFIIPDVKAKPGTPAVIRFNSQSSVTAALSLLNQPPMTVMDRVRLPVEIADGQAVLSGTLALPLRKGGKPSDVRYDVAGNLLALGSDTLVKGRSLRSTQMQLVANNQGLEIGGEGSLDGIPFEGKWTQPIGKGAERSTLTGNVALSPEALTAFNVSLPPGTVAGTGSGILDLVFQRGSSPTFALNTDLRGMRMSVPQLGWSKAADTTGSLRVTGALGAAPSVDAIVLDAPGLKADATLSLRPGGGMERLRVNRLQRGDWLDIPVDLLGKGSGRAPQVVVRGGTLDLRRATFGGNSSGGGNTAGSPAAPPMLVNLDRLQVTDTIFVDQMSGQFNTSGGLDGPFQARLNGGTTINGTVVPQNGRSAVRITSNDAGGVFRSSGVLKQAVGGDLELTLLPIGSGGAFDGRLNVKKTRIKDAPAMAALLNAVSVVGLLDEMNGAGIYFEEVEADFRLTPNRMTLSRASAVGPSMGISMDGVFATDTGQIAFQGVITPVYILNGIGSIFTRKGEGVFGINYGLSGAATSPNVSINPLSALAPGALRDAFRAPQTQLPSVEGVTGSTLPQPVERPKEDVVLPSDER